MEVGETAADQNRHMGEEILPSSEQADKTPGLTEDVGSTDSVGIGSRMVGARESSPLVVRLPQPFHYSPSFCGFD